MRNNIIVYKDHSILTVFGWSHFLKEKNLVAGKSVLGSIRSSKFPKGTRTRKKDFEQKRGCLHNLKKFILTFYFY